MSNFPQLKLTKEDQLNYWKQFNDLLLALKAKQLSFNKTDIDYYIKKYNKKREVDKAFRARNILYSSVIGIAKSLANKFQNVKNPYDVLFQQGCLGIHEALLKYKPYPEAPYKQLNLLVTDCPENRSRLVAFSSYAYFWIKAKIFEQLNKSNLIKSPVKAKDRYVVFVPEDESKLVEFEDTDTISTVNKVLAEFNIEDQILLEYQDNLIAAALILDLSLAECENRIKKLTNIIFKKYQAC